MTTPSSRGDGSPNPMTLFATQLLPLLAFLVVDFFVTDVRISILSAVVFAVGQLGFIWARSRRFEWFVLLDVGLIAVLGGISIAFEDELFFKVKPAIVEGVGLGLVVALLLAPERFLLAYLGRVMVGGGPRPEAVGALKSMLGAISVCTVVHIGLVLYAAFHWSKEVWAFVSGPGYYLLVFPVVGVLALRLRSRSKAELVRE